LQRHFFLLKGIQLGANMQENNIIIIPCNTAYNDERPEWGLIGSDNDFCRIIMLSPEIRDTKVRSLDSGITLVPDDKTIEQLISAGGKKLIIFHESGARDLNGAIEFLFKLMKDGDAVFMHPGHEDIGKINPDTRSAFLSNQFNSKTVTGLTCFPYNGRSKESGYTENVWEICDYINDCKISLDLLNKLTDLHDKAKMYWETRKLFEDYDRFKGLYAELIFANIDGDLLQILEESFAYNDNELDQFRAMDWKTVANFLRWFEDKSKELSKDNPSGQPQLP